MRALIAGEFSGIITTELRRVGVEAYSADYDDTEGNPEWHIKGDYRTLLIEKWDLLIAHPDCTRLTNAGNKWYVGKYARPDFLIDRNAAIEDFKLFQSDKVAHIPRIAIENPQPSGYVMQRIGKYDQKIQPYMFGDMETKGVCWWLKGLPLLVKTNDVYEEMMKLPYKDRAKVHSEPPGPNRKKNRSRFFPGMARAIAEQWRYEK